MAASDWLWKFSSLFLFDGFQDRKPQRWQARCGNCWEHLVTARDNATVELDIDHGP
ncbi:uncharacterized protein CANTADRAFT_26178 [Suhomyces tanzawaensis NRRL Y-17324]|uniref:Uncharacterized protein n=1 Tax=Suhomyces tanzawaensis NRRL Y-17324 TaxID=984487 RepID=A0A1E4SI06_9ASCO|nr:uncharacterized protein CANTADRAFT_26178 [Suhomyces tanzawaensis NRRL Y-17324]ODV79144.1 hypothetical protein CANTADRAFT_26178 [Suhomyces tanzawaensis NRRL Y-17324]